VLRVDNTNILLVSRVVVYSLENVQELTVVKVSGINNSKVELIRLDV